LVRLVHTGYSAIALAMLAPALCHAVALSPSQALDRYLARGRDEKPECSNLLLSMQIDAALPALRKRGSMTGFRRVVGPGQIVYQGLRFTGDNFVRNQIIARFLARDRKPPEESGDLSVTPANYAFTFEKIADYNGLNSYVFRVKPWRKRAGLFRGELWLDAYTARPLRMWGDLVKSPAFFIRSLRFVEDYQTISGCNQPLRLLVMSKARIAGAVEMTVWLRPASEAWQATGANNATSNSKQGGQTGQ
jgi:hypothetical protein